MRDHTKLRAFELADEVALLVPVHKWLFGVESISVIQAKIDGFSLHRIQKILSATN